MARGEELELCAIYAPDDSSSEFETELATPAGLASLIAPVVQYQVEWLCSFVNRKRGAANRTPLDAEAMRRAIVVADAVVLAQTLPVECTRGFFAEPDLEKDRAFRIEQSVRYAALQWAIFCADSRADPMQYDVTQGFRFVVETGHVGRFFLD